MGKGFRWRLGHRAARHHPRGHRSTTQAVTINRFFAAVTDLNSTAHSSSPARSPPHLRRAASLWLSYHVPVPSDPNSCLIPTHLSGIREMHRAILSVQYRGERLQYIVKPRRIDKKSQPRTRERADALHNIQWR